MDVGLLHHALGLPVIVVACREPGYVAIERALGRWQWHGVIPEPLRAAHLVAGGMGDGHSRGRA